MTAQKKATVYWWLVLAASVGLSSYANIRHARLVAPGSSVATWTAGLMPVALLVMVEGMAFATRAGILGTRRKLATVGVGVLAAIVLVASYVGVLSTVRETHLAAALPWLEFAMAAVPDLLMIFATMYVMGLRASDADDEATTPSRWARVSGALLDRAEHAVVGQSDEFRSAGRPAADEPGRPINSTADEHGMDERPSMSVDHDRPTRSSGPDQAVHADEWDVVDRSTTADEPVEFGPSDRSTDPLNASSDRPDEPVYRSTEMPTDRPVELVDPASSAELDRPVDLAEQVPAESDDDPTEWVELAERVKSSTSITADTGDLARVLELDAAGATRAEIAGQVGRAKSTISGWIRAAADAAPERPQLVAVHD